jgi:hypothetical protein
MVPESDALAPEKTSWEVLCLAVSAPRGPLAGHNPTRSVLHDDSESRGQCCRVACVAGREKDMTYWTLLSQEAQWARRTVDLRLASQPEQWAGRHVYYSK